MNLAMVVQKLASDVAELTRLVLAVRSTAGGGEANTASNQGVGGVGLYHSKVGVDLQFKNINAGSTKITVTNDVPNKEVDIDVVPANISHGTIGGVTSDQHHAQLHAASHGPAAGDALKLDDLATPDDNTDLNASITRHGLLKKLPNEASQFINGIGEWSPAGGGTSPIFFQGGTSRRWFALMAYAGTGGGAQMGANAGITLTGSGTNNFDSFTPWRKITCGTVTPGGYYTTQANCRKYWSPTAWIRIKMDSTISNFRLWCGFYESLTLMNAADPAGKQFACFRYDTSVSGNWYFCTKDGAALNAIDTGVACGADTIYDLKITLLDSGNAYWYITPYGGATTSGNTGNNLPAEDLSMYLGTLGYAISGTLYYNWVYSYCEND